MAEAQASPSSDDVCFICCYKSDYFCIGQCDHPVCFECGTRMRVLCQSNECSICRSQISEVYVVNGCRNSFASIDTSKFLRPGNLGKQYGFKFESEDALSAVTDILAHVCTLCKNEPSFRSFVILSDHMRRVHELYYCDLCVDNLKLFSWERKCYNRSELARHRRCGDPDDRSHTGHPLCEFCDERYLDDDFLFRHLRRDHFFCHFCDADGKNKFYSDTDHLKQHFREQHFLCEIGQCKNEHLGVAFRHEIDFKGHKATSHGKDIQKNELKKELQVNVAFHYGHNPVRDRLAKPAGSRPARGRGPAAGPAPVAQAVPASAAAAAPVAVVPVVPSPPPPVQTFDMQKEDFPSLLNENRRNNMKKSKPTSGGQPQLSNVVAKAAGKSMRSGSLGENDFPSLVPTVDQEIPKGKTSRFRRDSHSVSPKMVPKKGFRMVDDDEDDFSPPPSADSSAAESPVKEVKKVQSFKDVFPASDLNAKGSWGPPKLNAAGVNEAEFPLLPSKKPKKKTGSGTFPKTTDTTGKPAWSQKVQSQPATKVEPVEPQPVKPKLNYKDYPPLVSLPKTKARARLVAQNKQRPSVEEHTVEKSSVMPKIDSYDDVKSASFKTAPPPQLQSETDQPFPSSSLQVVPEVLLPPPGLCPPPPGFQPQTLPTTVDSSQTLPVTVNGSSSEHVEKSFTYIKPKNFQKRNRDLFDLLKDNLTEEYLDEFKRLSSAYRRGELSSDHYYKQIRNLLGAKLFKKSFVELLCLLPDVEKQNDLLLSAQIADQGGGSGTKAWKKNDLLDSIRICNICKQISSVVDYSEHCSYHQVEEDFPVLS